MNMVMHSSTPTIYSDNNSSISPFSDHSSFVLYLEPIYNSLLQTYQNIITLDCIPNGSLSTMVSRIRFPKLSTFQTATNSFRSEQCVPTLLRYPTSSVGNPFKQTDAFMGADDIPSVFSYLQTHGYRIEQYDRHLNHLVGGVSSIRFSGNRKIIAMVSTLPA
jgi:hypothetical protein